MSLNIISYWPVSMQDVGKVYLRIFLGRINDKCKVESDRFNISSHSNMILLQTDTGFVLNMDIMYLQIVIILTPSDSYLLFFNLLFVFLTCYLFY